MSRPPRHRVALFGTALFLAAGDARAQGREGVRILGDLVFQDVDGDGVQDWLAGRAECFSKAEGQPEVRSWCVALLDGRRFTLRWRKNVPRFGRFSPAIAGRWVVLDVGEPVFTAFDATRVDVFWEFRLDGPHTFPPKPVDGRILLFVGGDHLYLLDLEARRPLWDQRLWSPLRLAPVLGGARVAVATERELAVLSLADGSISWRLRGQIASLAAGDDETLYVAYGTGSGAHTLAAAYLAGGARRWVRPGLVALDVPLLVGQDLLYAFGGGVLLALDRTDGSIVWRVATPGRPTLLGADDRVLVLLLDLPGVAQEVRAHDRETGRLLWAKAATDARFEPRGALAGGIVLLWARDRAAVGALRGRVVGLDAQTGMERWSHDSPEKLVALLSADASSVRLQRERGFTVLSARSGEVAASHGLVALARVEKPLSERLRWLVYVVPALIIAVGSGAWVRHRRRRRR